MPGLKHKNQRLQNKELHKSYAIWEKSCRGKASMKVHYRMPTCGGEWDASLGNTVCPPKARINENYHAHTHNVESVCFYLKVKQTVGRKNFDLHNSNHCKCPSHTGIIPNNGSFSLYLPQCCYVQKIKILICYEILNSSNLRGKNCVLNNVKKLLCDVFGSSGEPRCPPRDTFKQ